MQTNITCSLPRKGKFPDQQLSVLLEVLDLAQWSTPRLKLHPLTNPPTGVQHSLATWIGWLPLLAPVYPFLLGPAFYLPWCLFFCLATSPFSLFWLCFFYNKIFRSSFRASHFEKYLEHKLMATLLSRSAHDGANSQACSRLAVLISSNQRFFSLAVN